MTNKVEKLLIVDDEEPVRQYLAAVCRRLGFNVETARDRATFERQLVSFSPAVILLDLQMPGKDGIKILRMLSDYDSKAKIILVSGLDERTLATTVKVGEKLGLNMDGALTKPVLIDSLRDKLRGGQSTRHTVGADEIEQAIMLGDIRPAYQAKAVRGPDGQWGITETEAFARWHRRDSSVVPPGDFIDVAERAGLLPAMTMSMLEQVVSQMRRWESRGLKMSAAVNLSPSTLTDYRFPDRLERLMQEYKLNNSRLTLELTESVGMHNERLAMEILSRLRILGFNLSIDDFGTGYSSLEQLYRMPFSELKIDRFLVRDIGKRTEADIIVEAIIKLGRQLKLDVCAEGVESSEALKFLIGAGCDKIQGFYVGRPSTAEALEECARQFSEDGFGLSVQSAMSMERTGRFCSPASFRPDLAGSPPALTGQT